MSSSYTILGGLAKGGMGRVYLGRVTGSAGFSKLVAIKRLHPELAIDKDFVAMLVDEARLAAQIRHTNVIDTLDLVASDGAFNVVLEYVEGESLSVLMRCARDAGESVPHPIALSLMYGVLRGLDAAHEARSEEGQPLGIVHRDVSPQNILLGVDGIPRIIDFGVAKAMGRITTTRPGEVRGKYSYMAPEQLLGRPVTRQVDVYAAGVLLWELLVGEKLFWNEDARALSAEVIRGEIRAPSEANPSVAKALDSVVLRATARELGDRFMTAREMLTALEDAKCERASDDDVGAYLRRLCAVRLAERQKMIRGAVAPMDASSSVDDLVAELARSGGTPHKLSDQLSVGSQVPVQTSTALISVAAIPVPPAPGSLSATGLAPTGLPARNLRPLGFALMSVACAVVVVTFLGVRYRTGSSPTTAAANTTSSAPEPNPPPVPIPAPESTGTPPPTETAAAIVSAPTTTIMTTATPKGKAPPKRVVKGPASSAAPISSDPKDYRYR